MGGGVALSPADARRVLAQRALLKRRFAEDPLVLCSLMVGVDQRDGSRFDLRHLDQPITDGEIPGPVGNLLSAQSSWRWQRYLAELVRDEPRLILGKGRQIGVTWIVLGVDVAEAILHPGTASLLYRQREDEAVDNLRRWWTLFRSLPGWVTEGISVVRPAKGALPSESGIALEFPDGSLSEVLAMSSAASSGHGRSVRRVVLDEAAYIEKLSQIGAAVEPAAGRAKITMVSTANGRANPETGEGNEFHRRWVTAEESGYRALFLAYDVHPDRDEHWYATAPEVRSLKAQQRNEQFPRNEHEAFRLTTNTWFDEEDLLAYAERTPQPLYRCRFDDLGGPREVEVMRKDTGPVRVFVEPVAGHKYAIGADVATNSRGDYSAAYVIDLSNMELVAEYHARVDADLYARDLHFLGRWFNTAHICIEVGGGFGETVIVGLRDGTSGRQPYPNMYRHVLSSRADRPMAKPFGMPMNMKTRPLVIAGLSQAIRERALPWVTNDLLHEMENFISQPAPGSRGSSRGPWPRAADGFHDDRVMAAAIALELYRLRGEHPERVRRKPKPAPAAYPWEADRVVVGAGKWPID